MGIASELIKFFHRELPEFGGIANTATTGDFVNDYNVEHKKILVICQKLEALGYLISYPYPQDPPLVKRYFAPEFNQKCYTYNTYDFQVFGFPKIRQHFSKSVLAVVPYKDEKEDIGSAFLMKSQYLVTAGHCITGMDKVEIRGLNTENTQIDKIWIPADDAIDLAIIKFNRKPFDAPEFEIQEGHVLDEVMTMGYPPIPNFDAILVAETATIASKIDLLLKATTGEIIAHEESYLTNQTYFLISARIKGGSSGGPVIGRHGRVVGVVTEQIAGENSSNLVPDTLGFGVVTPVETLKSFLYECQENSDNVKYLNFKMIQGGFRLL